MTDTLNKWFLDREHELDRKRSVALARQRWPEVIELEAKLDELKLWRKKVNEHAEAIPKPRLKTWEEPPITQQ